MNDKYSMMEGKGIFSSIKKFLKKHKVLSRAAKVGSILSGASGNPIFGSALGAASYGLSQAGYGSISKKPISKAQVTSILNGLAKPLRSGGVSLVAAKKLFPSIKNIMPSQMRALSLGYGRMMKGGNISLCGGKSSGYWCGDLRKSMEKCCSQNKCYKGSGLSLPGQIPRMGSGLSLPGQRIPLPRRGRGRRKK